MPLRTAPTSKRFLELDFLRALAIILMVYYHIAFDLVIFFDQSIPLGSIGWVILQRTIEVLFLFLVGTSFVLSWDRTPHFEKFFKRGMLIYGCGILITISTILMDPSAYVRFGILHFIGMSMIFLPFFRSLNEWNIPLGALIISLKDLPRMLTANTELLLPFGIRPPAFRSLDYFPMIPWLGVILIGMGLGHFLYIRNKHWRGRFPVGYNAGWLKALLWPGRHALFVYMVHQPIILGIMWWLHT